ncbi:hypothetical protein HDV00_002648 [Rhizophlyctis rosea]|nr:hypothetical protein HDV00_002648 [Rhizophlyctis rosea]
MSTPLTGGCHCKANRYTVTTTDASHLYPEGFGMMQSMTGKPARFATDINPHVADPITVPTMATHCHCESCRTTTGCLWSTLMPVSREAFKWETPETARTSFKSSETVSRTFCATCGTHLLYDASTRPWVAIFVGSLEDPDRVTASTSMHGQDSLKSYVRPDPQVPIFGYDGKSVYVIDSGLECGELGKKVGA